MLTCGACGREYADTLTAWRCSCGHPLDFTGQPLPNRSTPPDSFDRDRGLWAFEAFLPMDRAVTMGEGWTPLVAAPEWDAQFKLESLFPTGSFKDRGATTTVSRAVELGVDRVVEDSSGNAGLAIATYAARAGLDAEIYVPADAKPGKIAGIERTGADVVRIEGSRQDVTEACIDAVESRTDNATDATRADAGEDSDDAPTTWYASHAWNPAFFVGTSTVALEIAAQRDWTVPDAVVTPLGHGTLFLGAYRGFRALREAGWIDRLPRLLGAQAAGAAPIARALHGDSAVATDTAPTDVADTATDDTVTEADTATGEPDTDTNDLADGIQIREPVRRDAILAAIDATDGDAIAIGRAATEREHDHLAQAGFHVEPTCATATAALEPFRERGVVSADDDVVVALTGTGLKT